MKNVFFGKLSRYELLYIGILPLCLLLTLLYWPWMNNEIGSFLSGRYLISYIPDPGTSAMTLYIPYGEHYTEGMTVTVNSSKIKELIVNSLRKSNFVRSMTKEGKYSITYYDEAMKLHIISFSLDLQFQYQNGLYANRNLSKFIIQLSDNIKMQNMNDKAGYILENNNGMIHVNPGTG